MTGRNVLHLQPHIWEKVLDFKSIGKGRLRFSSCSEKAAGERPHRRRLGGELGKPLRVRRGEQQRPGDAFPHWCEVSAERIGEIRDLNPGPPVP